MPFGYLRDPLFLACFCLYWVNRLAIKRLPHPAFFHAHFNDLICIPFFVPMLVLATRVCGLRPHDRPPQLHEVMIPLVIWSVLFEIVFPLHPYWRQWLVGDPFDILYYTIGACAAYVVWQVTYRRRAQAS